MPVTLNSSSNEVHIRPADAPESSAKEKAERANLHTWSATATASDRFTRDSVSAATETSSVPMLADDQRGIEKDLVIASAIWGPAAAVVSGGVGAGIAAVAGGAALTGLAIGAAAGGGLALGAILLIYGIVKPLR